MRDLFDLLHKADIAKGWLWKRLFDNLFAYLKFFDHTKPDSDKENFYMEREWRVVGSVVFTLSDVERVILPRFWAAKFREDFPSYHGQLSFAD